MASLVLCSLTKWKGSFLLVQTEEKTKVALSQIQSTEQNFPIYTIDPNRYNVLYTVYNLYNSYLFYP